VVTGYVESMSRREIAGNGARITFGILALTALVALSQIVSSNRAASDGEGSWIMPAWVYEEEAVVIGTAPLRLSETQVIQVPVHRIDHHWHPLAITGWSLPLVATLLACAVAIRRRNDRLVKAGAGAALVVLAAAYFISPLVAWHIGPHPADPQSPGNEVTPGVHSASHAAPIRSPT
jgi:hypothetical protein